MFRIRNLENITKTIIVEIDGKKERFDKLYDEEEVGFRVLGAVWGMDEKTRGSDEVRNYEATKCVYAVAAYRRNPDGSYFGIQALFLNGEWSTNEDGDPMLRVWDRII